jgi:hypothetical protein
MKAAGGLAKAGRGLYEGDGENRLNKLKGKRAN